MASLQIHFSEEVNLKIESLMRKWNISKYDTIQRILKEYREVKDGSNRPN